MVHARQIKAARALLDWSQDDLALATGLSVTTVRNLESGDMSPRSATANVIRQAIENAGLEFIEPEGVRRRTDEVKIYQGLNSCDEFFDDMLQTVREKSGEIVSIFKSPEAWMQSCSITRGNFERLQRLSEITKIKCLLSEVLAPSILIPSLQFRTISKQHIGPVSFFVYGDKHTVVLEEGSSTFRFVVFNSSSMAQAYRNYFFSLWDNASPFLAQVVSQERRIRA